MKRASRKLGILLITAIAAIGLGGFFLTPVKRIFSKDFDYQEDAKSSTAGQENRDAAEPKRRKRDDAVTPPKSGPQYHTFDDEGFVNGQLLLLAGIPLEKRPEVQSILDETWNELSSDFQQRAVFVPEKSDEETGVRTYFVPARPETAKAASDKLRERLAASFGEGAARELAPYLMRPDFFAGFGVNNLEVNVATIKMGHGDSKRVNSNFSVIDPVTGNLLSTHRIGSQSAYYQYLGDFMKTEISSQLNP